MASKTEDKSKLKSGRVLCYKRGNDAAALVVIRLNQIGKLVPTFECPICQHTSVLKAELTHHVINVHLHFEWNLRPYRQEESSDSSSSSSSDYSRKSQSAKRKSKRARSSSSSQCETDKFNDYHRGRKSKRSDHSCRKRSIKDRLGPSIHH